MQNNSTLNKSANPTNYKYLFGPISSRRLGLSLGVDLVPFKTCTLDCVYCECGATTNLTLERKDFVKTSDVIDELTNYLNNNQPPEVITFSGAGEPTLAKNIEEIINYLKTTHPQIPVVVLTNGTLLNDPRVRKDLTLADIVIPSFDAATLGVFRRINKPHPKLNLEKIVQGLIDFRQEFTNKFWLEIFLLPSINMSDSELTSLKEIIEKIHPDKIQLNTLDRPGVDKELTKASFEQLEAIAELFKSIPADIVAGRPEADHTIKRQGSN